MKNQKINLPNLLGGVGRGKDALSSVLIGLKNCAKRKFLCCWKEVHLQPGKVFGRRVLWVQLFVLFLVTDVTVQGCSGESAFLTGSSTETVYP